MDDLSPLRASVALLLCVPNNRILKVVVVRVFVVVKVVKMVKFR